MQMEEEGHKTRWVEALTSRKWWRARVCRTSAERVSSAAGLLEWRHFFFFFFNHQGLFYTSVQIFNQHNNVGRVFSSYGFDSILIQSCFLQLPHHIRINVERWIKLFPAAFIYFPLSFLSPPREEIDCLVFFFCPEKNYRLVGKSPLSPDSPHLCDSKEAGGSKQHWHRTLNHQCFPSHSWAWSRYVLFFHTLFTWVFTFFLFNSS